MATLYGVNATKRDVTVPAVKIPPGEISGDIQVAYDQYTSTGAVTTSDTIKMMKLPAGCRIHNVVMNFTDFGTTGAFNVGFEDNGVEAADADAFFAAADVNTAAGTLSMINVSGAAVAGLFAELSAETQVVIVPSTNTTAAGTVKLAVYYSVI